MRNSGLKKHTLVALNSTPYKYELFIYGDSVLNGTGYHKEAILKISCLEGGNLKQFKAAKRTLEVRGYEPEVEFKGRNTLFMRLTGNIGGGYDVRPFDTLSALGIPMSTMHQKFITDAVMHADLDPATPMKGERLPNTSKRAVVGHG